ncbi:MAG: hypothetical protein ACE5H3_11245 [Planctomycetota bacterium]
MKALPPGLLAACILLMVSAGCGGEEAEPDGAGGPGSIAPPSSSLVHEIPAPPLTSPAPQTPALPRVRVWSGRVGGFLLRVESRPLGKGEGKGWSFRELPGSDWKVQEARLQDGRLILQLQKGGLLQGKHARFEADFHPSAHSLSGQVFQGTQRLAGSLQGDS